jgi:hypothetical protein
MNQVGYIFKNWVSGDFVGRKFRKWEPKPKIEQIFPRTFSYLACTICIISEDI